MIETFLFAHSLEGDLRDGTTATIDDYHRVSGRIYTAGKLTGKIVPVEIWVPCDLAVLKSVPPPVWCREEWMRDEPEWHNSARTGMCWVLQEQWRDGLDWSGKALPAVLQEARMWMFSAVRQLISRHYYGHLKALKTWPKEWDSWGHYQAGAKEYRRESRLRDPRKSR